MGIFDRLSTLIRSNINDLISRAENPEKMLNQLIVDMKGQLAKAKQQVASAIADEKKLQADAEAMKKQAEDWERRAMLAVQEGRDDLAKQALLRYNEAMQGAQQLHETWVKHKAETENLKASLRQLNDKIEEAKRKKNILIARARRAEAQQRIQETMSGMSDKSAFESFERMTEKIEQQERKAIAAAELQNEFEGDTLMQQFQALEYKGSADQQLLELKAQDGHARRRAAAARPSSSGRARRSRRSWWTTRRRRSRPSAVGHQAHQTGLGEHAGPVCLDSRACLLLRPVQLPRRVTRCPVADSPIAVAGRLPIADSRLAIATHARLPLPHPRRRRVRPAHLQDRQLGHPLPPRSDRGGGGPGHRGQDGAGRARLRRRDPGGRRRMAEGLARKPDAVLIGIAPVGGKLPG